jgi:hypothetical protein
MEILLILLVVPIGLYLFHGRGRGSAWGLVPAGEEVRGAGAYRETRVRTWKRGEAPLSVRVAALSSFFLGQMILPGGLAALVGLMVTATAIAKGNAPPLLIILTLSAPTGLVVAAQLLAAGSAMLAHADDAAQKARVAVRWALGHNVVLLFAIGMGALAEPREADYGALPALYAVFSIAQALLVRHAASVIEAYRARQDDDPAPVEAEISVLGDTR